MTQPDQTGARVLIVDDDTALAEHVGDDKAALAVWKNARPDLLIVDYSMPGMNGLELLTALRRLNGAPDQRRRRCRQAARHEAHH